MLLSKRIRKLFSKKESGQGLVEFSITALVLLVMVIGLFEVGYGLWGHLTLLNVNREAARFSIRPNVLTFDTIDTQEIGYDAIVNHTLTTNADQLNLEAYLENTVSGDEGSPKAAIIVTHVVVDTGQPCEDLEGGCCDDSSFTPYTNDDLVLHADMDGGYEHLRYIYPEPAGSNVAFESRINLDELIWGENGLVEQNNIFNCNLYQKSHSTDFTDNSVMIVETFYEQPQLLGFPAYSWFLNPLPLYTQTTLRVDSNAESRCAVLPIAVYLDTAIAMNNTKAEDNLIQSNVKPSGGKGWLSWSGVQNAPYLNEELNNPNLSMHDYRDPTDTSDTSLNAGDWIQSSSGTINSDDVRDSMNSLIGRIVLLPVYDSIDQAGSNGRYHVHSFAKVRIGASELPQGQGGFINGTIVEWPAADACPGDGA